MNRHLKLPIGIVVLFLIIIPLFLLLSKTINISREGKISETSLVIINEDGTEGHSEKRIYLTPENIRGYSPDCNPNFNLDPADTVINFTDFERGVSLDIPYNSLWGNNKYAINPFDDHGKFIAFGPIIVGDACSWVRTYIISFLAVKTEEQIIEEVKNYPELDSGPDVITINGLTVVKYLTYSYGIGCVWPTLVVIGERYNYSFSPICGQIDFEDTFNFFEQIIESLSLIN